MEKMRKVSDLIAEVRHFKDDFRAHLDDIDTLVKIADADDDSVLVKVISPADRRRIQDWRQAEQVNLESVKALGVIYEIRQQDPYIMPEFTPEAFQAANELAGSLLQKLINPAQ